MRWIRTEVEAKDSLDWWGRCKCQRFRCDPIAEINESGWQIRYTNTGPLEVRLWTVTNPPLTSVMYAVQGQIAYEQVQGEGFLEMWNVFPPVREGQPEGRYFSRTLADSGDLGTVQGTSGLATVHVAN